MRGILSRAARVVLVGALATLLSSACGDDEPAVSASTLLERAAVHVEQAQSFRFLLEFEGGSAEIVRGLQMRRAEGAFAGLDNLEAQLLVAAGPIDARVEIRVVNGESWMTNPLSQRWERTPLSVARLFDLSTGVTALMRSSQNPKHAGAMCHYAPN